METVIKGSHLSYRYGSASKNALSDIDIEIKKGELIAIIGHNGCGKSTLSKCFNALLRPSSGELKVLDIKVDSNTDVRELRRQVGMVFQNPDNQFVATIVEDDVAFGPENYQTERELIPDMVSKALSDVGMSDYKKHSNHMLSGGQKQRAAIAGAIVMEPDILILDEATSMLDPDGRKEVLDIVRSLHSCKNKTVIMVTHYIEESLMADRIFVMSDGRVIAQGTPDEILPDEELLASAGLAAPFACRVYAELKRRGKAPERCPLTEEELVEMICQ